MPAPREILLYGSINVWSAGDLVTQMGEIGNDDFTLRGFSYGGDVDAGWAAITKFSQMKGKKTFINDSDCSSMAAFFACYADYVECADYAVFGFHRAGYSQSYESDPLFAGSQDEASLKDTNDKLRQALEAAVNIPVFEKAVGVKISDIFSMPGRPMAFLKAEDALACGLVDKIIQVTPEKKAKAMAMLACSKVKTVNNYGELERAAANYLARANSPAPKPLSSNSKKIMTIEALKNEHPAVYAEIIKKGREEERECAGAWMAFADVDLEAAKKGIEAGVPPTAKQMAELIRKQLSPEAIAKVTAEAAPASATAAQAQPAAASAAANGKKPEDVAKEAEKAKALADWEAKVDASLGIKTKAA